MASRKYVLAIDAGSSSCRAAIFDVGGHLVSIAYHKWSYDAPPEVAPLGRQFDPAVFWDIVCQVIREAIWKAKVSPRDIIATTATSQRHGVVFLDEDGNELYAGPNTDLRALLEGLTIDAEHGCEFRRITGHSPAFLFTPAKLQWFKNNRPDTYERIATVLTINNWIIYRLSGQRIAEPSSDSDTGLIDIGRSCWSSELAQILRVPQGICPTISLAGTPVGPVSANAARQTGLTPDTLVVAGGADTQCGLLGMGVKDEGQVGIVAGWSAAIQMVTGRPIIDPKGKIWSSCHILPQKWVLESNAAECGGAYAWLKGILYDSSTGEEDAYTSMDRLGEEAPTGSKGVLAFIGPRAMDMTQLRPLIGGIIFPITPSVTEIERKHVIRAVLENLCFAFKSNCLQLEEISGLTMRSVSIGGGLVRSRTLSRILADVLAMPVNCFAAPEVTSYGASMCAAVGAGVYPDLDRACECMAPKPNIISPDPCNVQEYASYYRKWTEAERWLSNLSKEIM